MPPAEDVEVVGGGKSLTMEKSEKQNQLEGQPEKGNVKVWYKNIPSLDAITARLAIKTCALSIGSKKEARCNIFGMFLILCPTNLLCFRTIPRYQNQIPLHSCRNRRYSLTLG